MDSDDNELVKLGVDMSQLSDYMDNIVKVVNQHAKLLDKVSEELDLRPHSTNVGELFAVLTQGFPYEKLLKQLGFSSHPPRTAKVIETLTKHKVQLNSQLHAQQDQPVTEMFEGMERFLKIVELLGKSSVEAKEFQQSAEARFERIEEAIRKNVLKVDFESQMHNLKSELTNTITHSIDDF